MPAADFALDADSRTLSANGRRVRLQEQPFVILRMLLDRRGRVVTRDELRDALWPAGTYVDFEHSLNAAIKRLRAALGDDADNPRYIETIPRRGYRFIADPEEREAASGESPRTRLAVLPFVELDGEHDQDYFARGFTEEMTSELGRRGRGRLGVISSHSTMAFRHTTLTAREIGAALRADYLLEGAIRRGSGRVRVTARLIEASSETQQWVDTLEYPLTDWVAAQTEIAGHIAQSLAMELLPPPSPRLSTDTAAYQAYLKGRYHWQRVADTGAGEARRYFEEAIAHDPDFALAHAGLALVYTVRAWYYHDVPRRALEQARLCATRACHLDHQIAEVHVAEGDVKRLLLWDARGARAAYERAVALNPSFETAHGALARLFASAGRVAPAIREAEIGRELDLRCLTANTVAAWARYIGGDYDTAMALCRHTLEMDDTHLWAKLLLGAALLATGSRREALRVLDDAAGDPRPNPVALASLGHARAVVGDTSGALAAVDAARAMAPARYVSPYYLALPLAAVGETDAAFAALDRACDERDPAVLNIAVDPRLAVLRADRRYDALVARLRPDEITPSPVPR